MAPVVKVLSNRLVQLLTSDLVPMLGPPGLGRVLGFTHILHSTFLTVDQVADVGGLAVESALHLIDVIQ